MKTLDYIIQKFKPQFNKRWAEIPGTRDKELLEIFRDLKFEKGAEIGVERGAYSEVICKRIPNVTLYCIDAWEAYPQYREHVSQDKLDQFYKETKNRLKPYNAKIIKGFSEEVHKDFADGSLDFVYIDGNHDFLHITQDIYYWMPKVRRDGIVAGHDFVRVKGKYTNHVKDVIPAYAHAMNIDPWFVLREPKRASSWFWIKQ